MGLPGVLTFNTVSIAVFIAVLSYLLWRDRANIERYTILFIRRTDHGVELLDRVAENMPRIWRWWSTAGIPIGFLGMLAIFVFIGKNIVELIIQPATTQPALGVVVPTASTYTVQPGFVGIPFWFWILGLSTVLFAHELMHGVIARNEGFDVKSVGWLLFGIIPGAFVEPEGEEMLPEDEAAETREESREGMDGGPWTGGTPVQKLRVLAAGPWANFTVAILVGVLAFAGTQFLFTDTGVTYGGLINNTPAHEANLSGVITAVNGERVQDVEQLQARLDPVQPGDQIIITTRRNNTVTNQSLTMIQRPNGTADEAFIGVSQVSTAREFNVEDEPAASLVFFLFRLTGFVALLNLGIGAFNLLPIKGLDGGWMLSIALEKYLGEEKERTVMLYVTAFTVTMILSIFLFAVQRLIFG